MSCFHPHRAAVLAAFCLLVASCPAWAQSGDALSKNAHWQAPSAGDVRAKVFAYLEEQDVGDATLKQAAALWDTMPEEPTEAGLLEHVAVTLALADPSAAGLVDLCAKPKDQLRLPPFDFLADEKTAPLVANNLRLLYARWMVHESLYDEAQEQLAGLNPEDVVAPATLLFYQGVVSHTLLDKDAGLKAAARLIAGEEQSPRRYVVLARLMEQDLKDLQDESLDHIARRMDDIRRRLHLGRAGQRVQDVERGVIESLDKLIRELEQQQQQQSSSSSSGGPSDNIQSSSPAPDSMNIGGKGQGDVDRGRIGSDSGWGDLPPKEREEALQQIGREFPSHYRDVVEQYFRRLAAEASD
jgi:hypothetical protein